MHGHPIEVLLNQLSNALGLLGGRDGRPESSYDDRFDLGRGDAPDRPGARPFRTAWL